MPRTTRKPPADGLPADWSESARETYRQLREANPDMPAADRLALFEACVMLSSADACAARVALDGLMIAGSTGQLVAHPLIAEGRAARTQALASLRQIGTSKKRSASSASAAGSALVSARYHR